MKEYRANNALALAIRAVFLGMPLAVCSMTTTSIYAATEHNISIAKKSLDQDLTELAIQSGITISYDSATLSKLQSSGLKGHYSTEQALALLLAPHHLEPVKIASGGYSIQAKVTTASQDAQIVQLAPIHSQAAHLSNKNLVSSSKNELGVAQLPTISMVAASDKHMVNVGKSAQNLKEVPQSVTVISRERMDQQGLKTLDDVMLQTTGVTREQLWLNNNYSSRGLKIENIRYDGGGTSSVQDRNNNADMAQYESVALLRGADGLFGAGEAGGVINLTSKRPKAETEINSTLSIGSWNNYRAEIDGTGALNTEQTIQGRAVAVLQDQDFFYKPTHNRREMLYGALNFERSPQTTLFTGASYQKDKTDAFNASLPRWQDGADLNLPRSTTMGAPWGWMERENISLFANVQHIFNDDWKTQFNVRHNIGDDGINTAEMEGAVNYETLESQWWRNQSKTDFKETTVDLNLQGSFNLFDQKHDVILGIDHSNSTKDFKENWTYYGNGNTFEHVAPPEWDYPPTDWETMNQTTNKKTGLYGSLRFRPIENLALIAGGRYILKDDNNVHNFKALTGTNPDTKTLQDKLFIPYFGIVYDVTDRTTLYASSAEIYKSQANLMDVNNQPLDPITGTNYEIGIKSTLFNDQLNASFALYQVKKEGEGNRISGSRSSPCCYIDSGLYESKGFDLEVNGNITPEWDISVGYTYNDNENKNNTSKPLNSYTPKHLLKVWTNYKLDQFVEGLEVGGGVTAQSKNYKDGWVQAYNPLTGKYDGAWNEMQVVQPKYSLWSLRAAYAINPNLNLALNLNNIFDKRYYSTIGEPGYGSFYGEPRSFLLTLKAKY